MSTHHDNDNPQTHAIAAFISGLTYEKVPTDVLSRIKLLILDSLGCAMFGAKLEWSQMLIKTLTAVDTSRGCGVWGTNVRLSAPHSTLTNGTLVQSFELDDVHRAGVLHVGAVTLPGLVAIAEMRPGMSGKDFLRAAVAGYEIGPRVGLCMGPEHISQGWHSGATVGVFSSVGAAAAALKLDTDKTVHALGIAGTQASGLMAAQFGAMVKRMHAGRAAQSGLYGALLAENGFTGIVNVLESEYGGFCTTFSRSTDRFRLAELTAGLGEKWETMGIALKFYSCVGSNHTTLDALRTIQARRPFKNEEIAKIIVHGSQATAEHVGWPYKPQGVTSAQMNLPFCVGTLLTEGDVFVDQFSENVVTDPKRIALADKVTVLHDPAITALGAKMRHKVRVEVHFTDGSRQDETVEAPRGSENKFASEADVVDKFTKLTRDVIGASNSAKIAEMVLSALDKLGDVGALVKALAK